MRFSVVAFASYFYLPEVWFCVNVSFLVLVSATRNVLINFGLYTYMVGIFIRRDFCEDNICLLTIKVELVKLH